MIKRKLGGMFIAVSFILGVPAGILGSIAINTNINNKVRKVEREKYKDVLPFLLETENGVPIKAKVKDPIVVNVDMTGEERKQAIKAIHDLDSISNTLNYKIIDTDNSSIYADINISVDKNLQEAKEEVKNRGIENNLSPKDKLDIADNTIKEFNSNRPLVKEAIETDLNIKAYSQDIDELLLEKERRKQSPNQEIPNQHSHL